GGALRYYKGEFRSYTTRDGLPDNRVVRIDEDEHGTVWFFGDSALSRLRDGKVEVVDQIDGESLERATGPSDRPHSRRSRRERPSEQYHRGLYHGSWGHGRKSSDVDQRLDPVRGDVSHPADRSLARPDPTRYQDRRISANARSRAHLC